MPDKPVRPGGSRGRSTSTGNRRDDTRASSRRQRRAATAAAADDGRRKRIKQFVRNTLRSAAEKISHAEQVQDLLANHPDNLWYAAVVRDAHHARNSLDGLIRETLVTAIKLNALTQRDAAKIINVHENTIARWVQDGSELDVLHEEWMRQARQSGQQKAEEDPEQQE